MTQEDKKLLLKDLSARLPYGVMIQIPELFYPQRKVIEKLVTINDLWYFNDDGTYIENVKPYLRSMTSITEKEFLDLCKYTNCHLNRYFLSPVGISDVSVNTFNKIIDWLNAHHFDYRGLIKKGLAIEVTKENNPYEIRNRE